MPFWIMQDKAPMPDPSSSFKLFFVKHHVMYILTLQISSQAMYKQAVSQLGKNAPRPLYGRATHLLWTSCGAGPTHHCPEFTLTLHTSRLTLQRRF